MAEIPWKVVWFHVIDSLEFLKYLILFSKIHVINLSKIRPAQQGHALVITQKTINI